MTWRSLLWRAWRLIGRKRRYRKCLQSIARLERELFPSVTGSDNYSIAPGAVWEVESTNHVQIFQNPHNISLHKQIIEQQLLFGFRPNYSPAPSLSCVSVAPRPTLLVQKNQHLADFIPGQLSIPPGVQKMWAKYMRL